MRTRHLLVALACTTLLTGCATAKKAALRADIAAIQKRVEETQARIDAQTDGIGSTTQALQTRVSYNPLRQWMAAFNARPPSERSVTYQQTSNARIGEGEKSCPWPLGKVGYYVEFDSSDSTRARLEIQSLALNGTAGEVTLGAPMAFELHTKLHGHLNLCIGGGIGWRPRVDSQANWNTLTALRFGNIADGKVAYTLTLLSPNSLTVPFRVDLGDIGSYTYRAKVDGLARELTKGEITLLFDQGGLLGPLPDGTMRRYRIHTTNPTFAADPQGLLLNSEVTIDVLPGDRNEL